jgi:hypothetical protein
MFDFRESFTLLSTNENLQLSIILALAITFPILLPHQQLILGSFINALLYVAAIRIKGIKAYLPAFLPSLVVAALSILFAKSSIIAMLPIIWCGNCVLVYITKKFGKDWEAIGLASLLKPIVMGFGTWMLITTRIVPAKMLVPFFGLQFVTAICGALLVSLTLFLYNTLIKS